jgi:hypothetical protein
MLAALFLAAGAALILWSGEWGWDLRHRVQYGAVVGMDALCFIPALAKHLSHFLDRCRHRSLAANPRGAVRKN